MSLDLQGFGKIKNDFQIYDVGTENVVFCMLRGYVSFFRKYNLEGQILLGGVPADRKSSRPSTFGA